LRAAAGISITIVAAFGMIGTQLNATDSSAYVGTSVPATPDSFAAQE